MILLRDALEPKVKMFLLEKVSLLGGTLSKLVKLKRIINGVWELRLQPPKYASPWLRY